MSANRTKAAPGGEILLSVGLAASVNQEAQCCPKLEQQICELFDELRAPLLRHLVCLRVPLAEADEMVQESFLRLYEHLYSDGDRTNLRGWLFRVTYNLALARIKSESRLVHADDQEWNQIAEASIEPSPSPEDILLEKEMMADLMKRMASLPALQQHCFHLRAEGFRYREIAEIMGITVSTVSECLRRAIVKLEEASHV